MKIKILSCILLLVMCITMLIACSSSKKSDLDVEIPNRFILVESFKAGAHSSPAAYVIVDTNTGVCYLLVVESQGAGLTVMVDAAGNPIVMEEYKNETMD